MSFVGVIATNKDFEFIKNSINKKMGEKITLIRISKSNIENIRHVKFETLVICKKIYNFKEELEILKKIAKETKYIVINTDINFENEIFSNIKTNIITYGLNAKATFTISSIKEEGILLCLQRNIENVYKNIIEPFEANIKSDKINNKIIYNFLSIYAILALYEEKI